MYKRETEMARQKSEVISGPQIDQLIGIAETFERFFFFMADFMRLFRNSLEEIKRIRAALKNGRPPVHWGDILALTEGDVREVLERASLVKFELGTLWLRVDDSFDLNAIKLYQDSLKRTLLDLTGVRHRVRVTQSAID